MTNFYSVYLLIFSGFILLGFAFWFKHWYLFVPSAMAWAIIAIYFFDIGAGDPTNLFVYAFGYFAIALTFLSCFAPFAFKRNPAVNPDVEKKTDLEEMIEEQEEYRKQQELWFKAYRPRGKR